MNAVAWGGVEVQPLRTRWSSAAHEGRRDGEMSLEGTEFQDGSNEL